LEDLCLTAKVLKRFKIKMLLTEAEKGNPARCSSPSERGGVWGQGCRVMGNNYFTEMCSGSEACSYLRVTDCVYHSTLGLRVIKKKEKVLG